MYFGGKAYEFFYKNLHFLGQQTVLIHSYFQLIEIIVSRKPTLQVIRHLLFFVTGRLLVHEWGHYRWGLFNEYADKLRDLQRTKYFYYSDTNQAWEPTS